MGKPFRVEALLPENARTYFLERDSAAFRSLLSKVRRGAAWHPARWPWRSPAGRGAAARAAARKEGALAEEGAGKVKEGASA